MSARRLTRDGVCHVCGREFRHRQARAQATCSKSCMGILAGRWKLAIRVFTGPASVEIMCPLNWRACGGCGAEKIMARGRGSYRCDMCKARRIKDYYLTVRKPAGGFGERPLVCATCGKEWRGHGRKGPAFCSKDCHQASPNYRAGRKIQHLRRERRLKSVVVERFTSEEIFERDDHRCQICLRKLEMGKTVPHPLAPTIDHIVPLADGGPHTRANVQAAHFLCNAARGNRGAAQMRLA